MMATSREPRHTWQAQPALTREKGGERRLSLSAQRFGIIPGVEMAEARLSFQAILGSGLANLGSMAQVLSKLLDQSSRLRETM